MSNPMPAVAGFDSYIKTTSTDIQTTLRKWRCSWLYILALLHLYNEANVQLACLERDNAKRIDTIAEARAMEFI